MLKVYPRDLNSNFQTGKIEYTEYIEANGTNFENTIRELSEQISDGRDKFVLSKLDTETLEKLKTLVEDELEERYNNGRDSL